MRLVKHALAQSVTLVIVLVIDNPLKLLAWNAIALLGPGAEIDEPAAIGAERTVRVVVPRRLFAASWTLYFARHGT